MLWCYQRRHSCIERRGIHRASLVAPDHLADNDPDAFIGALVVPFATQEEMVVLSERPSTRGARAACDDNHRQHNKDPSGECQHPGKPT